MISQKRKHQLARQVLNGAVGATAHVFESLVFLGSISLDIFSGPSLYADRMKHSECFMSKSLDLPKKKNEFKEKVIRQSLWRLRKQGFVRKEGGIYKLTLEGKKLASYILGIKKESSKKWDGKYRIVIFDIPEKDRLFRNWFRQELYLLGYKQLQKSVFSSKMPLTATLIKEIKKCKMNNYINYFLVEKIYKNV